MGAFGFFQISILFFLFGVKPVFAREKVKEPEVFKAENKIPTSGSTTSNTGSSIPCEQLPQLTTSDLWNVADCHYQKRNYEKTIDVLREVRRRNSHELDAFFTAAWLLWKVGSSRGGADETRMTAEALKELQDASLQHPTNWKVFTEIGDFYFLRLNQPDKAYAQYLNARKYYKGDYARKSAEAPQGLKAAIEARIGRTAEKLGRKGEAVEASCRALFLDPDDKGSEERVERLFGSCDRKKVKDPNLKSKAKQADSPKEKPNPSDHPR